MVENGKVVSEKTVWQAGKIGVEQKLKTRTKYLRLSV